GQIDRDALAGCEFLGELGLTGELRAVDGILPAVLAAAHDGRRLVVPAASAAEAALAGQAQAHVARTLLETCAGVGGQTSLPRATEAAGAGMEAASPAGTSPPQPDLASVRGQLQARRALEIAAAGGHHLLMSGPPGCGKTLLASCLPGLLPQASEAEALETAAVHSISGRGLDPAR